MRDVLVSHQESKTADERTHRQAQWIFRISITLGWLCFCWPIWRHWLFPEFLEYWVPDVVEAYDAMMSR